MLYLIRSYGGVSGSVVISFLNIHRVLHIFFVVLRINKRLACQLFRPCGSGCSGSSGTCKKSWLNIYFFLQSEKVEEKGGKGRERRDQRERK